MKMRRVWAMPSTDTFSVPPIGEFVKRYLAGAAVSVDPFARNSTLATYTNDLNPGTAAQYHLPAEEFLSLLLSRGVQADVAIFDPPYSPRQITEAYQSIGRRATTKDTQSAGLYRRVRDGLARIVRPGGVVLSFGWNSVGMGKGRGFRLDEILLVCHGGAHNDTICLAETYVPVPSALFPLLDEVDPCSPS